MKANNIEATKIKINSKSFPIVAIGASAGGIEAITELLKSLPPDTGLAYVYIQHLEPNHESMLTTILSKATKMKVVQAEPLVRIEPDHLFIIPPDKNMSIIDGVIKLNDGDPRPKFNRPIDQFFVSLAEKQKEGAIGIVLSGTASDGTLGLKAIKAAGGVTFVQDESARFQGMPKSAIAEGVVDMVLSPENIAIELARLSKQTELIGRVTNLSDEGEAAGEDVAVGIPKGDDEEMINIIKLLKKSTGVDFLHCKRSTISRRILRRMLLLRLESPKEYLRYLQQHAGEANQLYQDLLINITTFRNPETLEYLLESTNEELMTTNTELQVRNEKLAESYEYAEALLDTIREAVIVLGRDFRVKMANKSFYQSFKVTEHETEGRTLFELGNRQWDVLELRRLLDEVINSDVNFTGFEIEHNFPLIGQKTMSVNAKKIVQKRHGQEIILIAIEDITEHRAAEKLTAERETWFRNMADNAPVMIWMTNSSQSWTFVNSTWLKYTGVPEADVKGSGWLELIHPDDRKHASEQYSSNFEKKLSFEIEARIRRHDGEYRWLLCSGKPTFSPDGNFSGFIGSCADVHDKRVLFEELDHEVQERTRELQETNKELSRSNSELQQFAYVASHDLQEPLRKIITFSDKLQQYSENIPEEGRAYIEKIEASSQRMTRLIDDLLNFSRISRSNRKFVRTDLNDILRDVLVDFDLLVPQKKAEIHFGKLPVIQAIPLQMEQLFHNLISNALKFTRSGVEPVITISSRSISPDETRNGNLKKQPLVEIIVEDNGIGFNPEFSEQIFTIFQRLNSKYDYPGTGIGLALCRKIAINHEGEMFAESEPGKGAKFHIILPVKHNVGS